MALQSINARMTSRMFVQHMLDSPNALLAGNCGTTGMQADLHARGG